MTAKYQVVMTACALILSAGVANAGPCNTSQTTGTGDGQQAVNRAAQADQRQEHVQPSVAQQPQSAGKAEQPKTTEQSAAVPSAKMTDQDQSSAAPPQGSETSTKMADQGCWSVESLIALSVVAAVIIFAAVYALTIWKRQ